MGGCIVRLCLSHCVEILPKVRGGFLRADDAGLGESRAPVFNAKAGLGDWSSQTPSTAVIHRGVLTASHSQFRGRLIAAAGNPRSRWYMANRSRAAASAREKVPGGSAAGRVRST